jgi:hypothetical protein
MSALQRHNMRLSLGPETGGLAHGHASDMPMSADAAVTRFEPPLRQPTEPGESVG